MAKDNLIKQWEKECSKHLVGKKIYTVRYMTDEEMEEHLWDKKALVIIFTDGSYIYASSDDEGNNGGALFTSFDNLPTIPVI
jgi:hypothetical protein